MKNARTTMIVFFLSIATVMVQAQEKFSQVKVYVTDKAQRTEVIGLLDIDHFITTDDGAIVSEVSAVALKKLAVRNIRYKVMVDDVARQLEAENEKFFAAVRAGLDPKADNRSAFNQVGKSVLDLIATPAAYQVFTTAPHFGGHYTLAQMNTAMDNLVATYDGSPGPNIAQKILLGNSIENRPIYAIKISDNVPTDEPNEPEVLFIGLQHAREAIGGSSMIFLMQYLCEQYSLDPRIQALVNNREIYIIPCANPDGLERNRRTNPNGGGSQRKNRRKNGSDSTNCGIDLNRNYGVDWGNCPGNINDPNNSCGSQVLSGGTYFGTGAFSEPESQAIRNFVINRNFVIAIDQHAYGPYYSLPFGRPSLHVGDNLDTEESAFYTDIPALMGTYNGMRAGNSPQSVGYEVAGGIKDWLLRGEIGVGTKGKVYAMTGEGGAGGGTPAFGSMANFWAPASQIINLCKGMTYQNLQLIYAAGAYVDIEDLGGVNITGPDKQVDFDFRLKRIGLNNEPVTVSLIPIQNVKTVGAPVTINSIPTFGGTVDGSIHCGLPFTLTNGQRLIYAWKIETGGYVYYDTITKFFNSQALFTDDMETGFAGKWTTNGGWTYSTNDAFGGTRSLHESNGGNYNSSDSIYVTYNNSVTQLNVMDATSVWLSFMVRHRAENFRDKLRVLASTNGTTWTPVVGNITVQEPTNGDGNRMYDQPGLTGIRENWTRATFDLSAFAGLTNNLRLRFVFTSDANSGGFTFQVDDGFFIDDLQLIKSTIPIVTLPVNFGNITGKLLSDRTIQIDWEAQTDELHDYFEIEKSADGVNFKSIGEVHNPPFRFIDKQPFIGNNYYRVKQYDKNNNFTYSKVINVVNNYGAKVTIYPNPLSENDAVLTIKVLDEKKDALLIRIADAQGREVVKQAVRSLPANGEVKINTTMWSPNVYVVKITDKQGSVIAIQKIIKK